MFSQNSPVVDTQKVFSVKLFKLQLKYLIGVKFSFRANSCLIVFLFCSSFNHRLLLEPFFGDGTAKVGWKFILFTLKIASPTTQYLHKIVESLILKLKAEKLLAIEPIPRKRDFSTCSSSGSASYLIWIGFKRNDVKHLSRTSKQQY